MFELLLGPALCPNLPSLAVSPPHICCQFPDAGLETWPRCLDPPAWRHCVRKLLKFTTDQAWSQLVPLMRVDTRVTDYMKVSLMASKSLSYSLILCNSIFALVLTCEPLSGDWTGRGCGEQAVVTRSRGNQEKAETLRGTLTADWSDRGNGGLSLVRCGHGSQSRIRHALSQSQISIVNFINSQYLSRCQYQIEQNQF